MSCHNQEEVRKGESHTLLVGRPNVGKSVVFSKLTDRHVQSANYEGTTVDVLQAHISHKQKSHLLTDAPGVYLLDGETETDQLTHHWLEQPNTDLVVVLDGTQLERELPFLYQLLNKQKPTLVLINFSDLAMKRNISVDVDALSEKLGVPFLMIKATDNDWVEKAKEQIFSLKTQDVNRTLPPLVEALRTIKREPSETLWSDRLNHLLIHPVYGLFFLFFSMALAIGFVVGGGKAIRSVILLPLVNGVWRPFIEGLITQLTSDGLLQQLLIGEYGVLIKGIEWPFALILPYVFLFYIILSLFEDTGYLARVSVLLDGLFSKMGLPGQAIVPFMLGYGCSVPAILGTRTLRSRKERLMVTMMVSVGVPCTAQTGAFIALLGDRSLLALGFVFLMSIIVIVFTGWIMHKFLKTEREPVIIDLPPLLMPDRTAFIKKLTYRMKHFIFEAEVPMVLGILLAAFLVETNALVAISSWIEPVMVNLLGLPKEASLALLLGIIRRELAVMPLLEMDLTTLQLTTGAMIALFYLPCLSVLMVIIKEFKLRFGILVFVSTIGIALVVGTLVNQIGHLVL
ncbi:ferrous iron transport protein B [Pelagirhabdus alkalitolerans]|uniref:Ferrous iron transport protein B n=1 Tax=Pelagirhabdus alkalitolerans TaxID=1612202 RepID=A0A1G6GPV4_9BACI|nr:ferrous iron transporter B [Pelagirhabdus alkalitolerans]SDB83997.1 ferrous iron transport protein B [Pelagirhabdus alkalitolerans]